MNKLNAIIIEDEVPAARLSLIPQHYSLTLFISA